MIPGVLGQQGAASAGGGGSTPDWLPEGAVAHLDFVNELYWAGGAERTDTDILGGDYNPAKLTASLGLFMQIGVNMFGIEAIGALFSDLTNFLQSGCIIVVDVDARDAPSPTFPNGFCVYFFDDPDPDAAVESLELGTSSSPRSADIHDSQTLVLTGSSPNLFTTTGIQSLAYLLNALISGPLYRYAVSVNSNTGQNQDKSYDAGYLTPQSIRLFAVQEWDFGMEDVYVRRLTVYPPITDLTVLADYSQPFFIPVTPDATFADVVFLSSFDGVDGATAATDDSPSGHTITFVEGELDTAEKKFGTASLLLNSTADVAISVADHANWHFGADPFVIEGFVHFGNSSSVIAIRQGGGSPGGSWRLDLDPAGNVTFSVSEDGSAVETVFSVASGFSTGTQHYFCLERDSNKVARFWRDAALVAEELGPQTLFDSTADLTVELSGIGFADSWLDELRITKGAFWYGPDHPGAPVAAFPRS